MKKINKSEIMKTLTKNGENITTFQQLLKNLACDSNSLEGSNYTLIGDFELNGNPVTVYRHWSYDGNFHVYSDSSLSCCIGEIIRDGDPFPYLDENGKRVLEYGWIEVYDWNISIIEE